MEDIMGKSLPFTIIDLDKPRKLRFAAGAIVEFEEITGTPVTALDVDPTITMILQALWVMLKQDDESLATLKDATRLIDEYGDSLESVIKTTTKAIRASYRGEDEEPQRKNGKKPEGEPKA